MNENQNEITREAWIPTAEIGTFKDRVNFLNKKAIKLQCDPITYSIIQDKKTIQVPSKQIGGPSGIVIPGFSYQATKILISGKTPILNGYIVAGKIDHDPRLSENIVLELNNQTLPHHYRKASCNCEHCNTNRTRSKTYILKNIETGDFKQIGSTCLKDYTGHSDPEWACKANIVINEIIDELSEPASRGSLEAYVPLEKYLEQVAELVIREGFLSATKAEEQLKTCTAELAYIMHLNQNDERYKDFTPSEKAKKLAKEAIDYFKNKENKPDNGNFINNIITFANNGIIKEKYIKYAATIIPQYQKEFTQKIENNNKEHIGKEGEKHRFIGTIKSMNTYDSAYGMIRIYSINDEKGNNIVWKSSTQAEIEIGSSYIIDATIKKHSEYNNQLQTEIIRPKFRINKEIFDSETMAKISNLTEGMVDIKGKDTVEIILNSVDQELLLKEYSGISNISVYINELPENKHGKNMQQMNCQQILMLSKAIQQTGFSYNYDTYNTNKFIKNNSDIYNDICKLTPKKSNKIIKENISI